MRFLRAVCRIVFSLTFIFSGILKFIDPVGTGLKIHEYLGFLHLDFLAPAAVGLGIALSLLEFVVGISVLIGLRMRFFTTIGLCLTSFFTLLTLYLALFNPISDCGCFGEAVHLTNWQTFFKNVGLLLLIVFIFICRDKATRIAPAPMEWGFVGLFALLGLAVALQARIGIPQVDFTAYNIGREFSQEDDAVYETVFHYSKDGKVEEFTLDNLPDSTWTFVDSSTELVGGSPESAQLDFRLEKMEGRFFAATIYDPSGLDRAKLMEIEALREEAEMLGEEFVIYSVSGDYAIADRKSMMTLNRSNGGVTYFNDGEIIRKWSAWSLDKLDIGQVVSEDSDVLVLKHRVHEQIYISLIFFIILALIALVRLCCKMFIK